MPIKITPEEFAEKHARRLKAAVDDIRVGVERVSESPTAKAAAKKEKMLQNITQAIQSGKWEARLKSVSLEQWKTEFIEKGLGRIATGIDRAHDKQVEFAKQLLSYQSSLQDKVSKMPDLTLEDSISRAAEWIRGMSKFTRK